MLGLQLGALLGGAVVTETIFSRPGIGRLAVEAILNRDFPLVQGTVLFAATAYVLVNLVGRRLLRGASIRGSATDERAGAHAAPDSRATSAPAHRVQASDHVSGSACSATAARWSAARCCC